MLLFVAVPERSTARKIWPASPPGLISAPINRLPPRLTVVTWSKVGVTFGFCALLERTHQNPLPLSPAPIKRLPLLATSSVPHWGALGMLTGVCQVIPPSVDRLNPPKSQAANSVQNWYWKPCPMLVGVLSTVNHSLSPLCAPPSLDCSTHDCPPFVERQISPQNVFTNRLR